MIHPQRPSVLFIEINAKACSENGQRIIVAVAIRRVGVLQYIDHEGDVLVLPANDPGAVTNAQ